MSRSDHTLSPSSLKSLVYLYLALICALSVQAQERSPYPSINQGRYLVRWRAGIDEREVSTRLSQSSLSSKRQVGSLQLLQRSDVASAPRGLQPRDLTCARLRSRGLALSCEPDYLVTSQSLPNDPELPQQWGLSSSSPYNIAAESAWSVTNSSDDTVVAVVDTGVDYTHPDLAANLWRNPLEIPSNGVDDDADGYIDDIYGINTITGSGDPRDDHGHGTHVSGIIGASGNNGMAVSGVAWNVKIMALKFLGASGSGSLFDAIEALNYLLIMKSRGVNITIANNSWGGAPYLQSLADVVNQMNKAGILFVAAAGNNGINIDINPLYPAAFTHPNVIAVGAVDSDGNLASFSNYGVNSVDLAAPGVSVLSTYLGGGSAYLSGTSMATPFVSGALALLTGLYPGLSITELKSRLTNGAQPILPLNGLVNQARALNAYNPLVGITPAPGDFTPIGGGPSEPAQGPLTFAKAPKKLLSGKRYKFMVDGPDQKIGILRFVLGTHSCNLVPFEISGGNAKVAVTLPNLLLKGHIAVQALNSSGVPEDYALGVLSPSDSLVKAKLKKGRKVKKVTQASANTISKWCLKAAATAAAK